MKENLLTKFMVKTLADVLQTRLMNKHSDRLDELNVDEYSSVEDHLYNVIKAKLSLSTIKPYDELIKAIEDSMDIEDIINTSKDG